MLKLTQITIECLFDYPQLGEVVSDAVWVAFLKEQEDNIRAAVLKANENLAQQIKTILRQE